MKKLTATILAVIYLSSTIGATLHLHYCMERLVGWGLSADHANKKVCPFCGMATTSPAKNGSKESKGCCKDELKQVKVDNDHKIPDAAISLHKPILQLEDHFSVDPSFIACNPPILEFPTSNSPPRSEEISLILRNCVFRI